MSRINFRPGCRLVKRQIIGNHSRSVAIAGILYFGSANSAYAYLDAGTGSVIIQTLVALAAVGAASVAMFWERVKVTFKSLAKKIRGEKSIDD